MPAVLGITSLVSQNAQNKAAIANNETQQAAQLAYAKQARDEAMKFMAPWLAAGAAPSAGMTPGAPLGVGGMPMGGSAPAMNTQRPTMPVGRSPQDMARSVMGGPGAPPPAPMGAQPGQPPAAPPAPAQPPAMAAPPGPTAAAPPQQLTPAQLALFHHIFPQPRQAR